MGVHLTDAYASRRGSAKRPRFPMEARACAKELKLLNLKPYIIESPITLNPISYNPTLSLQATRSNQGNVVTLHFAPGPERTFLRCIYSLGFTVAIPNDGESNAKCKTRHGIMFAIYMRGSFRWGHCDSELRSRDHSPKQYSLA